MSQPVSSQKDFNSIISGNKNVLALFYASWCPFSRKFLPIFEEMSEEPGSGTKCVKIDDDEALCEKYSVEVYPSVLFFSSGKLVKRLDSLHGIGLNKKQFTDFLAASQEK